MKFDILTTEATSTVSSTETSTSDLEQRTAAVDTAVTTLTQDLAASSVVASAVEGLALEVLEPTGRSIVERASSATAGTRTALGHFSTGDGQMATNAQSSERQVRRPDMPGGGA